MSVESQADHQTRHPDSADCSSSHKDHQRNESCAELEDCGVLRYYPKGGCEPDSENYGTSDICITNGGNHSNPVNREDSGEDRPPEVLEGGAVDGDETYEVSGDGVMEGGSGEDRPPAGGKMEGDGDCRTHEASQSVAMEGDSIIPNGHEVSEGRAPEDKQPDSAGLDTESAGVDDADTAFVVRLYWDRNVSLLEYCRDKGLFPDLLDKILRTGTPDGKSWCLDSIDKNGYAPIHYIMMNKEHKNKPYLLEALVINGADIDLTTTYREGLTAVHLAVELDDLDCVKTLISLDADVNLEDCMGKTPLDLARIKKKLVYFPKKGIKMTTLDHGTATVEDSFTASESAALRTAKKKPEQQPQQEEIIKLLESVGAKKGTSSKVYLSSMASVESASSTGPAYGTHYNAASFRKINTTYYREVHDTIRRTLMGEVESVDPREAAELVKSMRMQEQYRRRCGSRVLCLDGGGIRGLLQIAMLREMERQTGRKIVELFDWIVGTSTGGIIALSLTYGPTNEGRKTVRQLRNIYWGMKDEIFGESQGFLARGNTQKLEATLKGWLGEDVKLNQETYPKVLIPAVFKKDTNLDLHFFNNCFGDEHSSELVWKVGRYTSAAPFYFTEFENYIDGGMLVNNPSEAALTVIQDFYHARGEKIPISLLVSVGSGVNPSSPLGEIDIKKNLLNPRAYLDLMEVLENAVLSKQTASNCLSRCREQGIEYFRFNPELKRKVDSDQQNSKILQEMVLTTRQYLNEEKVKEDMDRLVQLLNDSELTST